MCNFVLRKGLNLLKREQEPFNETSETSRSQAEFKAGHQNRNHYARKEAKAKVKGSFNSWENKDVGHGKVP